MPEPIEVIITDPQGRVIFGAGQGALSRNQKISGTLTLTLSLFASKVVKEQLQFVRFANHRMIFVALDSAPDLYAVSLVEKAVKPAQFVPMTTVFLDLVGRLYATGRLDEETRGQLQALYEFISIPTDGLLVAPPTSVGFYSAVVFAVGLIYDLGFYDAQKVIASIKFTQQQELPTLIDDHSPHGVLSCFTPEDTPSISGVGYFVTTTALDYILRTIGADGTPWEILARLFGQDSNAMSVARALSVDRAREIGTAIDHIAVSGRTIDELADDEDDLLLEALRNCVLSPEDAIEILENIFGSKLEEIIKLASLEKEIEPGIPPKVTPPEIFPEELPPEIITDTPEVSEPSPPEVILPEEEVTPSPVARPKPIAELIEVEECTYELECCPVEVAYIKGVSFNQAKPVSLDRRLSGIIIRIFEKSEEEFDLEIALHPDRSRDIAPVIEDIMSRFGGQPLTSHPNDLVFSVASKKVSNVIRGLTWTAITEFLRQMQMKLLPPSEALLFLNEGSIMLIPPKRRFDPKQLPSQILKIVREQEIEEQQAKKLTDRVLIDGATIDQTLMELVVPLKQGGGVAFVPRDTNEEIPEIMLWLLTISEISGVGFSRW